jgi:hypothetical protein
MSHGWIGGLTHKMIGGDFIGNYYSGLLYKTDIQHLYDLNTQQHMQAELIAPSLSSDFGGFISPPYVAFAMSWLSLPLPYAFAVWEILNLICVVISAYLITKFLLSDRLTKKELPLYQFLIILLSTFTFVVGFLAGQSHGITLLLCTGIIIAMIKNKWFICGLLGSLLLYKPQFVIGFLVCWIIWRRFSALFGFGLLAVAWQIPVIARHGFLPYLDYLHFTNYFIYLPFVKDFYPTSTMATPYSFIASLLPSNFDVFIQYFLLGIIIGMSALQIYVAYKSEKQPSSQRFIAFSMAVLFPFVASPYTMIYDLLILVLVPVLLTNIQDLLPSLKLFGVIIYPSLLFLPLLGYLFKVALPGLIPIALLVYLAWIQFRPKMNAELS